MPFNKRATYHAPPPPPKQFPQITCLEVITTCPQPAQVHQWVAHRVEGRVACPSWGAPPRGPKTWVVAVVEMTEVKKGGLIALVQRTSEMVLVIAGLIACRTCSFPSAIQKSV